MSTIPTLPQVGPYGHQIIARTVAALGPDARAFFAGHGYTLARLARRNRCSEQMMQALFAGRSVSARLVRNLTKLRAVLEARDEGGAEQ